MAEFVFTYRMPQDYVPGGAKTRKAWQVGAVLDLTDPR